MSNIHNTKYGKYYGIIKDNYCKKTCREIIQMINDPDITKTKQIIKIAASLGINKREGRKDIKEKFREKDEQALKMIADGMSCTQAAKILGVDQQSMNYRLKKYYNLEVLLDGKKKVDSHFFDVIDTEEKAYWLGFLYADGYVTAERVELCVQARDRNHLLKFKKSIDSQHDIQTKKMTLNGKKFEANRVSINDKMLVSALAKHGCTQKKSLSISFPQLSSRELYRHFVRGYFDGDGSITNHGNSYFACEFSCASESFMKSMKDYMKEVCHIKTILTKDARSLVLKLRTTSRWEAVRFMEHLYSNSVMYLDRKKEQYLNICRLENILQDSPDKEDGIKRGWRNVD